MMLLVVLSQDYLHEGGGIAQRSANMILVSGSIPGNFEEEILILLGFFDSTAYK